MLSHISVDFRVGLTKRSEILQIVVEMVQVVSKCAECARELQIDVSVQRTCKLLETFSVVVWVALLLTWLLDRCEYLIANLLGLCMTQIHALHTRLTHARLDASGPWQARIS